jgi:hypothetical protein
MKVTPEVTLMPIIFNPRHEQYQSGGLSSFGSFINYDLTGHTGIYFLFHILSLSQ